MKTLLLSCALLLLSANHGLAQQTHYYQTQFQDTGEVADKSFVQITSLDDGGAKLHFEKGLPQYKQQEDYVFNSKFDTILTQIRNPDAGTDYKIEE